VTDRGTNAALAATFVEPKGTIRSVLANGDSAQAPPRKWQIAYLAVFPRDLVLFKAKRGAFRPKTTDEVLASAPRDAVRRAHVGHGRSLNSLEIRFADGTHWEFDIPRVYLDGAEAIEANLAPLPPPMAAI
jgi:hypothetical protein